jgi:hypothetical protein
MTVRVTRIRIFVEEPGQQLAAEEVREVILEQSGAGISASGSPFPQGVTKDPLTMYDTGLMQDIDVAVTPGRIEYFAPYAEIVQGKYNWAGVSPQYMADVDRRLQTAAFTQYVKSETLGT